MTNGSDNVAQLFTSPQVDLSRIPRELRDRAQWCLAGPDKAPRTVGGAYASSTDASTWSTFDSACAAAHERGWDIGYMLTADDPFACIDLDVKDSTTAEQWERFNSIVQHFDSYSELSRSGRGMHVWVQGKIGTGCKRDGVEVYSQERFIICTGNTYLDKPIADRQETLLKMVSQMRGPERSTVPDPDEPQAEDDNVVIERAMTAANAEKFSALWNGAPSSYPSTSEADMALMAMIAFYSPNDAQCKRIFRTSALGKREKVTKSDRYLNLTLRVVRGRDDRRRRAEHGRLLANNIIASALCQLMTRGHETTASGATLDTLCVDWDNAEPMSPDIVADLVADEEVTLLGGHGGIGKGFLALQFAVGAAVGAEVLGHSSTGPLRVLYYSAEDGRKRIGRRMRSLLESYADEQQALAKQNLRIVDASELDPLYGHTGKPGLGTLLPYAQLQRLVESFDPRMIVIDGASDTFDGNEIVKREVRSFVKALLRLHPKRRVAVLLIVHIDRASARGHTSNDEGYSGNVAWHNSCRRRLYLQRKVERDEDTNDEVGETILLRVMKNQDGPPTPDIAPVRQPNGFWQTAVSFIGGMERGGDYGPTVLRLIGEYYERRQWISTSLAANATAGVFATLQSDPSFPPLGKKRTADIVRKLEREQKLTRETYRRGNGGKAERWKLT